MSAVTLRGPLHLLTLIFLATAAGSYPGPRAAEVETAREEYPTLQGRFAEEGVLEPRVALEVYSAGGNFYISYESADGIVYAGGNWSNRINFAAEQADTAQIAARLDYAGGRR